MQRFERDGLQFYQHLGWSKVKHGVFTRHGGASPKPWASLNAGGTVGDTPAIVHENHRRMYAVLDVNGTAAVTTWQVHGVDVVYARGPVAGRRWLARADAVITDQPDVPLVMRFADCVPLLFFDPVRAAIGLAHAGWRGTVQGMATQTIAAMRESFGSEPAEIEVVIGPSISGSCYQVGEEVVTALHDYFGTLDGLMQRDPADGTAYVDLWAANRLDLERAGVEKITTMGLCTYQHTQDFFSHRAENGRTGRFGVVMSL